MIVSSKPIDKDLDLDFSDIEAAPRQVRQCPIAGAMGVLTNALGFGSNSNSTQQAPERQQQFG